MKTSNILLVCWSVSCMLLMSTSAVEATPAISQADIEQAIIDLQAGSDLARADLVCNLIELGTRRADEVAKIQSLDSLIRLGAAVLKTRDRSIDTNAKVGIWPTFDALAHGAKFPIFVGTDPASITDANLRRAYEGALTRHKETLARFSTEKQKDEAASEALAACKRLLTEMNTPKAEEQVRRSLAKLADDPWLAARVTTALYPPAESKTEEAQPTPHGRDTSPLNPPPLIQPPTIKKATETKLTASTPSEEPTSSTSWSIIGVFIVAATGLLWLLVKKRK